MMKTSTFVGLVVVCVITFSSSVSAANMCFRCGTNSYVGCMPWDQCAALGYCPSTVNCNRRSKKTPKVPSMCPVR